MAQVSVNSTPILIIGATGFLGGFLAGELKKKGRKTLFLVRPRGNDSTPPLLMEIQPLGKVFGLMPFIFRYGPFFFQKFNKKAILERSDTISQLAENIQQHYAISNLSVAEKAVQDGSLQKLINGFIDVYYPYFCDKRIFDDHRAKKSTGAFGDRMPSVDIRCIQKVHGLCHRSKLGVKD